MKNVLQYGLGLLGVALIVFWQTGYNPFAGSGDIGVTTSPADFAALKKTTESDGKRIAVIGHFTLPGMRLTRVIGRPVSLSLESPSHDPIDFFDVEHGQGANEFYVPEKFTNEDLKVYDNAKNEHGYNEELLISFTMKRVKEAEPEKNPATGDYVWRYEKLRIDPVEKR